MPQEDRIFIESESEPDPDGEKHAKERAKKNAKKKKLKQKKKQAAAEGQAEAGRDVQRPSGKDGAEADEDPASEPMEQTASTSGPRLPDQLQPSSAPAAVRQPSVSPRLKIATAALLGLSIPADAAAPAMGPVEHGNPLTFPRQDPFAPSPTSADAAHDGQPMTEKTEAKELYIEMPPPPLPSKKRTDIPSSVGSSAHAVSDRAPAAGGALSDQDFIVGLGVALVIDTGMVLSALKPSASIGADEPAHLARKKSLAVNAIRQDSLRYKAIVEERRAHHDAVRQQIEKKQQGLKAKAKAAKASTVQAQPQTSGSKQEKTVINDEKAERPRHEDEMRQPEAVPAVQAVPTVSADSAVSVISFVAVPAVSAATPPTPPTPLTPAIPANAVPAVSKGKKPKKSKKGKKNEVDGLKAVDEVALQDQTTYATSVQKADQSRKELRTVNVDATPIIASSAEQTFEPASSGQVPLTERATENCDAKKGDRDEQLAEDEIPPPIQTPIEADQREEADKPQLPDDARRAPSTARPRCSRLRGRRGRTHFLHNHFRCQRWDRSGLHQSNQPSKERRGSHRAVRQISHEALKRRM